MSGRKTVSDADSDSVHRSAATAFARRVTAGEFEGLESLVLFGSTARGDASDRSSDVDFLAVVSDDADRAALTGRLHDVAYDVMLEHGPVVEVHVLSNTEFERRRDHPFVRRALREGESYV